MTDPDDLDGCDAIASDPSTDLHDDDVTGVVLFADIDPTDLDAVERRRAEWQEIAHAS